MIDVVHRSVCGLYRMTCQYAKSQLKAPEAGCCKVSNPAASSAAEVSIYLKLVGLAAYSAGEKARASMLACGTHLHPTVLQQPCRFIQQAALEPCSASVYLPCWLSMGESPASSRGA